MKKIISIIALLIVATTGITKAQDAALVAEVKKCIELQNTREAMAEAMALQFKPMVEHGQLAIDNMDAMSHEIADALMTKLNDKLIEFYCENYTIDEIKTLNAFYATPVGQKNIKLAPKASYLGTQITQDPAFAVTLQTIMAKYIKQ